MDLLSTADIILTPGGIPYWHIRMNFFVPTPASCVAAA